ncbi:uncharacterized protein LOC121002641 [Bufo bufo]|uniref:uncharacterized protein LOC121002641 n=1 Tax=Bufo bufo TaxID=8384 RepID=UPI001ABED346|nr:uncharacterized protein LOC121002641 [Bufo bufo]
MAAEIARPAGNKQSRRRREMVNGAPRRREERVEEHLRTPEQAAGKLHVYHLVLWAFPLIVVYISSVIIVLFISHCHLQSLHLLELKEQVVESPRRKRTMSRKCRRFSSLSLVLVQLILVSPVRAASIPVKCQDQKSKDVSLEYMKPCEEQEQNHQPLPRLEGSMPKPGPGASLFKSKHPDIGDLRTTAAVQDREQDTTSDLTRRAEGSPGRPLGLHRIRRFVAKTCLLCINCLLMNIKIKPLICKLLPHS